MSIFRGLLRNLESLQSTPGVQAASMSLVTPQGAVIEWPSSSSFPLDSPDRLKQAIRALLKDSGEAELASGLGIRVIILLGVGPKRDTSIEVGESNSYLSSQLDIKLALAPTSLVDPRLRTAWRTGVGKQGVGVKGLPLEERDEGMGVGAAVQMLVGRLCSIA
jgi:hypothetical protein